MKNMFADVYRNRCVLVTGHTGFKGSWLTAWLLKMGARVVGVSNAVPTQPAMFEVLGLGSRIAHYAADIRDLAALRRIVAAERPDFVFHLAAQAIVSRSYADPVETITTNVIGTMNVLEALRPVEHPCVAVMITSDKCYDNVEWVWGYRETDAMGGKDIYSGSKGAAELVIKSYFHSFFPKTHPVRIGISRAGNVIGGGDWAKDRIVVDCMQAWSESRQVEIRSPQATRPWQHVLEPLSGYLCLGQALATRDELHGEAYNFGPKSEQNRTVTGLIEDLARHWGLTNPADGYRVTANVPFHEAGLLKLSCDKARLHLSWEPNLDYTETINFVGEWYAGHYRAKADMMAVTNGQISSYEAMAAQRGRVWAR